MAATPTKQSYTIACSSSFRDAVEALARQRQANTADIARSILIVVPKSVIAAFPDPGEPAPDDREVITLKSGPARGRPWRRKPRLQLRLAPDYDGAVVRRALALALAIDAGQFDVAVVPSTAAPPQAASPPKSGETIEMRGRPQAALPTNEETPDVPGQAERNLMRSTQDDLMRLRAMVSVLSFEPLPEGVRGRAEALHVLGFPPGADPDRDRVRGRFRLLATIHHPDGHQGNHQRMSQLNAAMALLRGAA
jgi:hypothetical protein